ncbi:RDD family protein [Porticoccaceae bacterium]|nr:RDD family protein [Porticoccaceae bacterium]MDA8663463.1 RDD family protein [Porticoccaceae bacterium]MDA8682295.1 RDD family protein [Porticoccaceae bacterium]MDA8788819.1 RDD family protein [Porticoccaceae bacterium]MDB2486853.1 RDD family protein [Porticoccaceae bacterium]
MVNDSHNSQDSLQGKPNLKYAGFWIRVGASFVDSFLLIILFLPLLLLVYGSAYYTDPSTESYRGAWDVFVNLILPIILTVWFWLKFSATPGKMLLKIQVLDKQTLKPMSLAQAVGRYFAYIVSAIPLMLGLLWVGFSKTKQGWHDYLAQTIVVHRFEDPMNTNDPGGTTI